jgi:OmpA-OmpF porin, OOP family
MKLKSQLWYGARQFMLRAKARGALFCVPFLVATLATTGARAQQCSNPLVSTCVNSDAFWPHAGPQRFAAVGGTETVAARQIGFGLVSTWLSRPVVLRVASPGPGGSDQFVVDNQVNSNFLFAYGATDRLQLDVGLPITLVQSGAGTSPLTGGHAIRDTAVRDARFGFTYALVPRQRISLEKAADEGGAGKAFAVTSRFVFTAPIGDNSDFAGERTVVFAPSISADYRVSRLFFGAEIGGRLRPVTEFAGARVGTQLTSALGAGVDVLKQDLLSLMLEARAYYNFAEQNDSQQSAFGITSHPNGKHIIPSEWMLGVRTAPLLAGDVSFFFGGGGPIPLGDAAITAPRFRFILGVAYAPMNRDSDGDGVPDRIDRCPAQPGERDGERPGCPRENPPPPVPVLITPPPPPAITPVPSSPPAGPAPPVEPQPPPPDKVETRP